MVRPTKRPKRTPVSGNRNILTVEGKDPNYKYTWVNDDDKGSIQRFKEAGYEFVDDELKVGDKNVDGSTLPSSVVSKNVGQGLTAYLMRQPMEFHEEDMAAKHKRVDELEADMKRELNSGKDGTYGSVEFERKFSK